MVISRLFCCNLQNPTCGFYGRVKTRKPKGLVSELKNSKQLGRDLRLIKIQPAYPSSESEKIVLQPRVCNLRSYRADPDGAVVRAKSEEEFSSFFASLADYIDNSKKTQDFEIISGRLAMIAFTVALTVEEITGNSLFSKVDIRGIAEAVGVSIGAIVCAAIFAWFSSARTRVGRIFTLGCNSFVDSLIDDLIDGLFYEGNESEEL